MKIPAFLAGWLARCVAPVTERPEHIVSGGALSPAMRAWRLLPANPVLNLALEEVVHQSARRTHAGLGLSIILSGVCAAGPVGQANNTAFGPGDIMLRRRSLHRRITPCGDVVRCLTIGFGRGLPAPTSASCTIRRMAGRPVKGRV